MWRAIVVMAMALLLLVGANAVWRSA